MRLIEIKDKKQLDEFVGAQPHAEFLQSFGWGEFQKKVEGRVMRFGVEDNSKLIAAATLVKKPLPFGMNYFYCPRGPIINYELQIKNDELLNYFFDEIKKVAQKESVIFLRFEPNFVIARSVSDEAISMGLPRSFQSLAMTVKKTIDIQVSKTIILDLGLSEDDLLKKMHQKTRYNIRLAEKKGVKIRESGISAPLLPEEGLGAVGDSEFDKFWDLMSATVNRDGFRLHEKSYYQKMLEVENIKLYFGEFENKILCAGIFSFFGDTAVYLHGASSNENREVMAPYLLQWEMIKKAKALGCKYYDFFGIDEKKWPGVTRFKRGFSGEEINYSGTFDVVFNKIKYSGYKFLRIIRRFLKFLN